MRLVNLSMDRDETPTGPRRRSRPEDALYAPKYQSESSSKAWNWQFESFVQDGRFACRMMRKNALVTTLAVFTLALGIGANTAVFSLVEAAVLRPLPYPDPQRLCMLWTVEAQSQRAMNTSYPDFRDWRQESRSFQAMAAFHRESLNLTAGSGPERVDGLHVTPGLFDVLGARPILGRTFTDGDDGQRLVLLDHRFWVNRFGSDPKVVGQSIQLDGQAYTVIGVFGPEFHFVPRYFVGDPVLYFPLAPDADRTRYMLRVVGRLQAGVSQQQAQSEMTGIAARLPQASQG